MKLIKMAAAWLALALAGAAAHAQGGNFVGTWRVDLGSTASYGVTYERVDDTTERRTGTTRVGTGAQGMGTLQINADGSYQLRYLEYELIYKKPVISGRWEMVPAGESFSDVGAIALLDAKPDPRYPSQERKWYVFFKEDGSLEARYPPYDGFAKIKLTGAGRAPAAARRPAAGTKAPPALGQTAPTPSANSAAAAPPRTFTPDQVRRALEGKTEAEVRALLGKPVKVAYGNHYYNGVERVFPRCPNGCNWQSFMIRFDNAGATVSSVELQSWLVE